MFIFNVESKARRTLRYHYPHIMLQLKLMD